MINTLMAQCVDSSEEQTAKPETRVKQSAWLMQNDRKHLFLCSYIWFAALVGWSLQILLLKSKHIFCRLSAMRAQYPRVYRTHLVHMAIHMVVAVSMPYENSNRPLD